MKPLGSLTFGAGLALAAVLTTAPPALGQAMGVRDCRATDTVTLPMVESGHDAITAHATDDLLGPSIFDRTTTTEDGTDFTLEPRRFVDRASQLDAYLACETPFMRLTHAEMSLMAETTGAQETTEMIPVFFYGWSNGADALVGRDATSVSALSGTTLVTDGPRLDLALQLARDAQTSPDITMDETPAEAFARQPDQIFTIVAAPTATRLTAGDVGTGAEGSVEGARQVLTTTSANRVIGDLLVVRRDFYETAPETVRATVRALLKAEEIFREDVKKQVVDFARAADMVLGDPALEDEMRTLWRGTEGVGLNGQVDWATDTHPRSFLNLINTGQTTMINLGMLESAIGFTSPPLDYASLGDDLWDKRRVETSGFDQDAATAAISAMSSDELEGNTLASVTILFAPNQATFPVAQYQDAFEEALTQGQIYAGAVLSIEAHSSYLGYLRGVIQQDWSPARQKRELASLRNTSTARALAVRDALIDSAMEMGMPVDESQITIQGRGIEDPLGGFCDGLPCPPKTKEEWENSRRVVFRVIGMESEAEVFTPLNEW